MSELSVMESVRQDYEEYINKQAKVIQWYEKENSHNQEIIIKDAKEIERLNNIIDKTIEYINDLKTQVDSKTYDILEYEKIDLLEILKGE